MRINRQKMCTQEKRRGAFMSVEKIKGSVMTGTGEVHGQEAQA
jgi:hypothetical protein